MAEYIDKDKLLEDIEHSVVFTLRPDKPSSINAELRGANKIIDRIRCAPAADVEEVRHGRWSMTKDGAAYCSACKRKMNPYLYGYAHCAMCGARMDGGVNRIEIDTVKNGGVNDEQ